MSTEKGGSSKGGTSTGSTKSAKAGWFTRAVCFVIALLLVPPVIASFEAMVVVLRNPDIRTRIFGHSQPMMFFFAGVVAYLVIHMLIPSPARKSVVDADPGGKLLGSVTGGDSSGLMGLIPVFLPTWTILLMLLYFAGKVAWPGIESWFSLFTFLVGFTWCYHLVAGFSRMLSEGSAPAIGIALPLVLVLLINMQILVGIWSLLFKPELWMDFNRDAWEGTRAMYTGTWDRVGQIVKEQMPEQTPQKK